MVAPTPGRCLGLTRPCFGVYSRAMFAIMLFSALFLILSGLLAARLLRPAR